ncbi:HugZ family protein [Niveispirillum fermenti]|uniref:HugZ family pyridoxamine 5'-phosphate oxidase n=1 Tax=Niveispirillum fermenti TaxID=1233113 RepID=UPI003A8BD995
MAVVGEEMEPELADPGLQARALMRGSGEATLATLSRPGVQGGMDGWPMPSLVLVAFDLDATPLLLISRLAEHTRNLEGDPRCGLLFDGTGGHADRLTGPRLSVQGYAERSGDTRLLERFIARHPSASAYAGFRDFALWRLDPRRGHMVAGFGRIHGLSATDLRLAPVDWTSLAGRATDIVAHMNDDHAEAIGLYATRLLDRPPGDWRMTGIDPEGCDLRCGTLTARLAFDNRVRNAEAARAELVRLAGEARGRKG